MKLLAFFNKITEGVRGPHEGRELELMLRGEKPLAMTELRAPYMNDEERRQWMQAIGQGKIIHRPARTFETPATRGKRHETDFFALPGEEWRMDSAQAMYDRVDKAGHMTDEDHAEFGWLLGYSRDDINTFIGPLHEDRQQRMPVAMSSAGVENAKRLMKGVVREANEPRDQEFLDKLRADVMAKHPSPATMQQQPHPQPADYSGGANTFYHVSENVMAVGTIIRPQGNTWVEGADKAMEQFRPKGFIERSNAVFMFPSFDDADHVGLLGTDNRVNGYLYEVEPIGERSWHHVYWYDEIIRDLRDNEQEDNPFIWNQVKANALRYWSGDEAADHGWEIMAPAAKVVKYLGPAEDVMYGEDSEWFESSTSNAAKGARGRVLPS